MSAPTTAVPPAATVRSLDDIKGWFPPVDQDLFTHFLSGDAGDCGDPGDLVELGVYLGKSAALIGRHRGPDETFTVCDLFGAAADDEANQRENAKSYPTLTRAAFEANYLALHDELPVVVQAPSSRIVEHVPAGSVRFLHVDASHLYEHVVIDVDSARTLLQPGAVVVFDDFRSAHTPGVSAAVWEAVFTRGLAPICLTDQKLYATFGDRLPHQERLAAWLTRTPDLWWTREQIAGAPVLRVSKPKRAAPAAPTRADLDALRSELATAQRGVTALERGLATEQRRVAALERGLAATITARLRRLRYALR